MERVSFETKDGVTIVGSWQPTADSSSAVLLLHMMPSDRTSWVHLQSLLSERGMASLAIDLRGHGESLQQRNQALDYRMFSDAEHQASAQDIQAALAWMQERSGVSSVFVVGASIGASLALQSAIADPRIHAIALLSPGESYRGIQAFPLARQLSPTQGLFVAASSPDDQASFESAKEILRLAGRSVDAGRWFENAGHGTQLFTSHPELATALVDWIAKERTRL